MPQTLWRSFLRGASRAVKPSWILGVESSPAFSVLLFILDQWITMSPTPICVNAKLHHGLPPHCRLVDKRCPLKRELPTVPFGRLGRRVVGVA